MASTQRDILTAVRDIIQDLDLTGVDEVRVRTSPTDGEHWFPGITVSATTEDEMPGTNERDDIAYGITVTMVCNDDADVEEDDLLGTWRQTIRRNLIHQKLPTITGCCTVQWDFDKYDHDNKKNLGISTMVLRVVVRETRV